MASKWTGGFGQAWREISMPGGRTVRVKDELDHDEISLEQAEVWKERQSNWSYFWPSVALGSVLSAVLIYSLFIAATLIFSGTDKTVVAAIVSASFVSGLVAALATTIGARVNRIEMHALTLHETVLRLRDALVKDET